MKTRSAKTELALLLSAIHSPNGQARRYILSRLKEDDLATEESREVHAFMLKMAREGITNPFAEVYMKSKCLSKQTKAFLQASPEMLAEAATRSQADIDGYLYFLKMCRKSRKLFQGISTIAEDCKGPISEEIITAAKTTLQAMLLDLNAID